MELVGRSKGVGGDYLNKIDWVPQLMSFFQNLPNGTCLLGEIVFEQITKVVEIRLPQEKRATMWAVNYINTNRKETEKLQEILLDK